VESRADLGPQAGREPGHHGTHALNKDQLRPSDIAPGGHGEAPATALSRLRYGAAGTREFEQASSSDSSQHDANHVRNEGSIAYDSAVAVGFSTSSALSGRTPPISAISALDNPYSWNTA
jgi:hypothetical protein